MSDVPGPARLVVGAAVVDSLAEPRLLLAARRVAPAALAGRWEFPGGKVEAGETPEQALHRELDEELAVRVRLGPEVTPGGDAPHAGWPLGAGLVLRLWQVELIGIRPPTLPPVGEDHDELRWLDRATLADVPWLPADAAALARLAGILGPPLRHTGTP